MKQPIGEFLATLRRANGFTQQEVADRLGISNRTLSAWERGTAMPDILLLPALADLYGVTVDEILRGERSSAEKPAIAQQSAQKIYGSKAARFSMWAFILSGTALVGLVLFYAGYYTDWNYLTYGNIEQFEWWLILLYLGAILCAVCLIVLFALWKYNDNMLDEDDAAPYRVAMKKCVAVGFIVTGIVSLGFSVYPVLRFSVTPSGYGFVISIISLVITVGLLAFGISLMRAVKKQKTVSD